MIAQALTKAVAEQWLAVRRSGAVPSTGAHEIGRPPRGDLDERIAELAGGLLELGREVAKLPAAARAGAFDSTGSVLVHRKLQDLPVRIAADRDFWRYLCCGPLYDVISVRHEGSRNLDSFGLGRLWEALPERLWFRGHVSVDRVAEELRYDLTRRGTVDFWSSGPIRHLFGCSHSVVRALARFQFPEEGEFTKSGGYRPQTLKFDGIRELFTRLNHFNATIGLEVLNEESGLALIEELAADLPHETD